MDDLKLLYSKIENPIDNKIKWNKLLNMYSASLNYDDFYSRLTQKSKKDDVVDFDNEDKKTFCLVMWSMWKSKILKFNDDELRELIENKQFDYDMYDVIGIVRNLESIKTYGSLQQVLTNPSINRYFSLLFDDFNHKVEIYSDFNMKKDISYNTVLSIKIDAIKLYKVLKLYISLCVEREIPYYIKYQETGKKVIIDFYTKIDNLNINVDILNLIKKENQMYFHSHYELLSGNINDNICIKNKDIYNKYSYLKERSTIFFKSIDSVTYEYILKHLNTLVSYKEGRMNITEYLSTYVMENVINDIVKNTIKTTQDYFYIANSDDLLNLKKYIKEKIYISINDILNDRLYLKDDQYEIPLKLNNDKTIKLNAQVFMCAMRNLTLTLMSRDNSLEKAYRVRIKNECEFYRVDYNKLCLDTLFVKKVMYDKKAYSKYQEEISKIHDDIRKVETLDNLISQEINDDARAKIFDSMNELNKIFNVEEGS